MPDEGKNVYVEIEETERAVRELSQLVQRNHAEVLNALQEIKDILSPPTADSIAMQFGKTKGEVKT